jgi:hypothetical protein
MVGQPAKVGRGLRSIAINIANLAKENDRFQAANGKVDIALQKSNGEMRSTYDIMNDLGKVWGNLNETEQTSIATALAGKTQFEVFANVMKNWGAATKVVNNAVNANGSSLRENEKYLDSIEGKIQAFQSAWEQLSYHLVNSDLIKGIVDIGTTIIKTIDDIVQEIGAIPTAIGAIGAIIGSIKLSKLISGFIGLEGAVDGLASSKAFSLLSKELTTWISTGSILSTSLPLVAAGIAGVAAAFALAKASYDNTFRGRIEELGEIKGELSTIQGEIEALQSKEGSLNNEEQARLNLLKAQENILRRQIALKEKEASAQFNREAEKKFDKKAVGYAKDSQYLIGTKSIQAYQKLKDIEKEINDLEEKRKKTGLSKEDEARVKSLTNQYEDALKATEDWNDALIKEHDLLENVNYNRLSEAGKSYYDNIHSAFLQMANDNDEVRMGIEDIINTYGSAQFDSWNIDVSSLKDAEDLYTQVYDKIKGMDSEETITIYARDETGQIIDTIEHKKGDLTDEEWQMVIEAETTGDWDKVEDYVSGNKVEDRSVLLEFKSEGLQRIEAEKEEATKEETGNLDYTDNGTLNELKGMKIAAVDPVMGTITYTDSGTLKSIQGQKNTATESKSVPINFYATGLAAVRSAWASLKASLGFASGKRKGEEGGLAWLGDEGSRNNPKPELVVSENGKAYLAGTTGWEMYPVKDSDTVYTYSETKKLLGGKQAFKGFAGNLPRYAKGKKGKKKKREEFDKKLERLEHKRKVNHWTDAKFQKEYKKLYNKYKKYLSKDQKWDYSESREDYQNNAAVDKFKRQAEDIVTQSDLDKFINKVKNSKNLSKDEKNEIIADARSEFWNNQFKRQSEDIISEEDLLGYISSVNKNAHLTKQEKDELIQSAGNKYYSDEFDRQLGILSVRGNDRTDTNLANYITDVRNNQYLTEQEKEKFARDAYEAVAKYNLKEYENGVKTRDETLASIEAYYAEVGKYDETYYQMLDDLREADKEKEMDRLKELQETHENRLSLAEKYVRKELNIVQKQIDAEKEEADALEKLNELEKDVAKAKSNKVRVYREGIGFVYERDTEAIEKAEKALSDY